MRWVRVEKESEGRGEERRAREDAVGLIAIACSEFAV
jgi:hypothetical protein